MKPPKFQSEFEAHGATNITGSPLTHAELNQAVQDMTGNERAEAAQQNLLIRAVRDFYFAKYFYSVASYADYEGNSNLEATIDYMSEAFLRQAVVSIATTFDLLLPPRANDGTVSPGRTASLPHLLDRLKSLLLDSEEETSAELALLEIIKNKVDPAEQVLLRYVRHMRNKWAGHSSLDLRFDSWAQGNESASYQHLEEALVLIIDAFQDFSELSDMSDPITQATSRPPQVAKIDPSGAKVIQMGVEWSNVTALSDALRVAAYNEVQQFFLTLAAGS